MLRSGDLSELAQIHTSSSENSSRGLDWLPELKGIALFRILQESLTNVHRRSGSSAVEISLKVSIHQAVFTVKDFGRGMPAELIGGSQTNGDYFGVGRSGMRERVNDLAGKCEIQSTGDGAAIQVSIPLVVETSDAERDARKNSAA